MSTHKRNPRKKGVGANPLMEVVLAFAKQGWLVLPMGSFVWHKGITQANGGPCRFYDRLCTLTGWQVARLDMWEGNATGEEAVIRAWWADWPKAYVVLIGLSLPGFARLRPMFVDKPDRGKPEIETEGEPATPIARVLSRLDGVQPESGGMSWMAHCPAHDDSSPSLHVTETANGDVVFHCHAGCEQEDVREALGLPWADLFASKGRGKGKAYSPETRATVRPQEEHSEKPEGLRLQGSLQARATTQPAPEGCTPDQYAEAKRLPIDFLRGLGLSDCHWSGRPAVRVPYFDQDGNVAAVRFRTALEGKDRFR
jgi:hypothetical protein